jgi:hypothetical protein
MSVRDCRKASLALWRPTAQTRHLGAGGRLIDEDQARWIEIELSLQPCHAFTSSRCCSAACAVFF